MFTVKEFIENNKELLYDIHKALCLIPSPSTMEDARAVYCEELLKGFGYEETYIDSAKNVICPINCEGSNEITVVVAHTDTVFPDTEPMPFVEKDGKIFCPGVGDDTASLAIMLMVAKYFAETGYKPPKGLLLVCNSCEEGLGNLKGTRTFMEEYKGRVKQFLSLDSDIKFISAVCVGSHRYKVKVSTTGGHSWQAFGNKNAIAMASEIIGKIYSIELPKIGNYKTSYNVGIISGGTSINTIAQSAEFLCEYRSESIECLEYMKKGFEDIFNNANEDDVKVDYELIAERPCGTNGVYEKGEYLIPLCTQTIKKVAGVEVGFRSASTDCNIPLSMGVPAICIGVYYGGGAHTREEYVIKDSLPLGFEIAVETLGKMLEL
ncbi:MAG: M20/M25/M40 family metallo-hydrolase [Clostridia bacterium]|nr:M20/M25/M40 family metallo-hydrolase [Clostridia bacterium]